MKKGILIFFLIVVIHISSPMKSYGDCEWYNVFCYLKEVGEDVKNATEEGIDILVKAIGVVVELSVDAIDEIIAREDYLGYKLFEYYGVRNKPKRKLWEILDEKHYLLMGRYFRAVSLEGVKDRCKDKVNRLDEECIREYFSKGVVLDLDYPTVYFGVDKIPQSGMTLGEHILIKEDVGSFNPNCDSDECIRDFTLLAHELYHVMQYRAKREDLSNWIRNYFLECLEFKLDPLFGFEVPYREDIRCNQEQGAYRFQVLVYVDMKMDRDGLFNCQLRSKEDATYLYGGCDYDTMTGCDMRPVKRARDALLDCLNDLYNCQWSYVSTGKPDICKSLLDLCPFEKNRYDVEVVLDSDEDYKGNECDSCPDVMLSNIMDMDDDCVDDIDRTTGYMPDNCACNWEGVDKNNLDAMYERGRECLRWKWFLYNPDQADYDRDGVGDVCDTDIDGDGIANISDFDRYNPYLSLDIDGDGYVDFYNYSKDIKYRCVVKDFKWRLTYEGYPNKAPYCSGGDVDCKGVCKSEPREKGWKDSCERIDNCPRIDIDSDKSEKYKNFVKDWVGNKMVRCVKEGEWTYPHLKIIGKPEDYDAGLRVIVDTGSNLYRSYFSNVLQRDTDGDGVGDECDEDVGAGVMLSQKTGFLVSKGKIYTKAYSTSVEGDIYTTGFTFLNNDIVFSTAEDFANYKRINKMFGRDRQDITIGACKCKFRDNNKCINNEECVRPDKVAKPFYYNADRDLEYINPNDFYKKRYYNPIYISNPEKYAYMSPLEKKFDICLGIEDVEYKWGANDDFTVKKFCIRKGYQFGVEKRVDWVVGNTRYPINIWYPKVDFKKGWDFRGMERLVESWEWRYDNNKQKGLYFSVIGFAYPGEEVRYEGTSAEPVYTQFRIGSRDRYKEAEREDKDSNPPDGIYNYTVYTDWQELIWREGTGGKEIVVEDDKPCHMGKCSPVSERLGQIENRIGGCNPVGSYIYLKDGEAEGYYGLMYNGIDREYKMVFRSKNNVIPEGLRDYTQIIEVSSLFELGIDGGDKRERGVIFIYGGIDKDNRVRNDLYIGYEDGVDGDGLRLIRWEKVVSNGGIESPYAVKPYLIYDRANGRIIVADGTGSEGEWVRYIYRYNFLERVWERTDWVVNPKYYEVVGDNYSINTTYAHDKRYNVLWGFGGVGREGVMGWIWRIDLNRFEAEVYKEGMERISGEEVEESNGPGKRERMAIYYDGYSGKVMLFGGRDERGNLHNDLWEFDIDEMKWSKVSGDTDEVDRVMDGVLMFDSSRGKIGYTRGLKIDGGVSGVISFDLLNKKWIKLRVNPDNLIRDGEKYISDFNIDRPPEIRYIPKRVIPISNKLKMYKMVNESLGLKSIVINNKRGNMISKGIRMSPEEYGSFVVCDGGDYSIVVNPNEWYDENSVHGFEIEIRDGEVGGEVKRIRFEGVKDIELVDSYLYAVGIKGLKVIDLRNIEEVYSGREYILSEGIEVVGNYAYISQGSFGVVVVDVSNPERPIEIGRELLIGYGRDIKVRDDRAYIASGVFGIQVVDVSDKRNPRWIDTIYVRDVVRGIELYKGVIIANGVVKGIRAVDYSGKEVSRIYGDYGEEIYLIGDMLHIKVKGDRYVVYDVIDVRGPEYVGRYDISECVVRFKYYGRYAIERKDRFISIREVMW